MSHNAGDGMGGTREEFPAGGLPLLLEWKKMLALPVPATATGLGKQMFLPVSRSGYCACDPLLGNVTSVCLDPAS